MPKSPPGKPDQKTTTTDRNKLDRKHRHSLQPLSITELPPSALRHTQSHRYDSQGKTKKKKSYSSQIPSIIESENSDDELEKGVVLRVDKVKSSVIYENEKKGPKNVKPKPKEIINRNAAYVFENPAFDGSLSSKRNSAANSSRAPSVQSLEIVREQYCCCAKRTKCERTLLTVVIVLSIIIIVLVIVIVFVAKKDDIQELRYHFNL